MGCEPAPGPRVIPGVIHIQPAKAGWLPHAACYLELETSADKATGLAELYEVRDFVQQ